MTAGGSLGTLVRVPDRRLGWLPWLVLAVAWTWPTAIHPITATPGSAHTDLWESLWTLWLVATKLASGQSPLRVDGLLDAPHGGSLWPSDPLSAIGMMPVTLTAGPAVAWSLLVVGHMTLRGWLGYTIGSAYASGTAASPSPTSRAAGWVCGAILALSSMALADVHNGASESLGDTWCLAVVWLGLRWRPAAGGRAAWRGILVAGLLLAAATIAHWYGGVGAFLLWLAMGLRRVDDPAERRGMRRSFLAAAVLGVALAFPAAYAARSVSTAEDNVVGIKSPDELARLRRNIGPADPAAFVRPAPFRSPDFTTISRYGEDYWHCPYLGWVAIGLALASLVPLKARGDAPAAPGGIATTGAFWAWSVIPTSVILASGPVLTAGGTAVILPGRRAVPLPYFLLEKLPPFDSLSLLWKLGWTAEIGVALCAAKGIARIHAALPRRAAQGFTALALAGILLEAGLYAPTRGLPDHVDTTLAAPILALRAEPPGKVMTWPLIGGLPTLYEQIGHGKMVAGRLNFPASQSAWRVTKAVLRGHEAAIVVARWAGVRYVVLHLDAPTGADESGLQLSSWDGFPILAEDERVRVLKLY